MRKWEKKCKDLCRELVMRKSGKRQWCQMCGHPRFNVEQHHGLLKSGQRYKLNPFYWYDPTLQFCLCPECHKGNKDAPHVNQAAFEAEMLLVDPEKIQALQELKQGPLIQIDARTIDWEKVYASLEEYGRPLGIEIYEELKGGK